MPSRQPQSDLYTVAEAARILDRGRSTIYRLIKAGDVPYRTMANGQIRFTEADLDEVRQLLTQPVAVYRPAVA